jgi:hypothetical protein
MVVLLKMFLSSLIPQLIPVVVFFLSSVGKIILKAATEAVAQVPVTSSTTIEELRTMQYDHVCSKYPDAAKKAGYTLVNMAIGIAVRNLPQNKV